MNNDSPISLRFKNTPDKYLAFKPIKLKLVTNIKSRSKFLITNRLSAKRFYKH
jgi:hypothetical protein